MSKDKKINKKKKHKLNGQQIFAIFALIATIAMYISAIMFM